MLSRNGWVISSFILFFVFSYFSCSDVRKVYFGSYHDLIKSDYITKGWVPEDFPENTSGIELKYNLDTNQVWIKCRYSGEINFGNREISDLNDSLIMIELAGKDFSRNENLEFLSIGFDEYIAVDTENKNLSYYRDPYAVSESLL